MSETTEKLRSVPIFSALDTAGLERVATIATEFEAPAGQVLIEHGHAGTGVFVIEEGTVRIDRPDGSQLALGPGEFFGELAVLADSPRTARVSAVTAVRCLAIRRDDLTALLESEPSIAIAMARALARRLVDTA
ncbi:MAG: cyclic nucleotide-binding domain-containing protein [Actinobacteria bacterium]|nr:MAG: cyclic nucleotide-binding domain-containing protein [Actinomycetota bacterium]